MNVVRVYGGLGNQLFQYAFGRMIECKGGLVKYDTQWYVRSKRDKDNPRPFRLDKFKTSIKTTILSHANPTILENHSAELISIPVLDGKNYVGYWQSPRYFNSIREVLQNEFKVKEEFYTPNFLRLREEVSLLPSVAIHVRRGDFLSHPSHHIVPIEYYNKAISLIKEIKGDVVFYVFSDDLMWCKRVFKNVENIQFVRLEKDYLEFEVMRHCKNKIMGNSTFSWWPAYLENDLTITPKKWWVAESAAETMERKGLLIDNWIKL